MAKATTAKRRRKPPRMVAVEAPAAEDVSLDIVRRLQGEIVRNPVKWTLISLGLGYLYGRFRR